MIKMYMLMYLSLHFVFKVGKKITDFFIHFNFNVDRYTCEIKMDKEI